MAFVIADRVKETTTTAGTGTVTLAGAAIGFQSFAAIGNGNNTYYTIAGQTGSEWEVGIGTYTASGTTLSRDTVLSSSNGGALVNFSAGTKDVFVTQPAPRSLVVQNGGAGLFAGTTAFNANGAVYAASTSTLTSGTLPIASGGTNTTTTPTAGAITYGTGTAYAFTAAGTTGQVLTSAGASVPTWTTATNANTASAIVQRDSSGNFSAGTITALGYTAPSNGSGAGTKTLIQGSTGTGQAGASGGNGYVEILGGGATPIWTAFGSVNNARRRGGVVIQGGTSQADAGGTYVNGSNVDIYSGSGTTNGTATGINGRIFLNNGTVARTDGGSLSAASILMASASGANAASTISIQGGTCVTATDTATGASIAINGGTTTAGGDIIFTPGVLNSTSTPGKAYVFRAGSYEVLDAGNYSAYTFTTNGATSSSLPGGNGLFSPASNSIAVATSFLNAIYIDSSQNVSIGQSAPVANNGILQVSSFASIKALLETATITAAAPSATTNFDVITQAVQYYTTNASANFTLNIRGNSGTSLNTIMQTGQSVTIALLVTNGATAYYPNAFQIDGASVTPKWQGGTAPVSGTANGIDSYSFVVIKTAAATFTVLAAQTSFK